MPFILVMVLLCTFTVSVSADPFTDAEHLQVGERDHLWGDDGTFVSSDPSVIEIVKDGSRYYAAAVGTGRAVVSGGEWMGVASEDIHYVVHATKAGVTIGEMGWFFYLLMAGLLLVLGTCVYIYVEAPKCGMSRLWALTPLFSNMVGVVIFFALRSQRKKRMNRKNAYCTNCGAILAEGAAFCSSCGTKLR